MRNGDLIEAPIFYGQRVCGGRTSRCGQQSRCEQPPQNESLEELIGTIGGSTRPLVENKVRSRTRKHYLREAEPLIKERYGVTTVPAGELRRFKVALYRGDSERPKRAKRKQPKLKG